MKKDDLIKLGLTEEQAAKVMDINGADIEHAKSVKDKEISTLTTERDDLKSRLDTAENTLKGFEGIDPEKMKSELKDWQTKAEQAQKDFDRKIMQRDQSDWIESKLQEYGVESPYARKQIKSECMADDSGLKWKDGAFFGFDDFMKAAKEKDKSLYLTAEEKKAAEEAAKQKENAPKFTAAAGNDKPDGEKFVPPKIF